MSKMTVRILQGKVKWLQLTGEVGKSIGC